jgi:hypothetical protein
MNAFGLFEPVDDVARLHPIDLGGLDAEREQLG